jgi:FkbM family methyltransferase
MRRAVVFSGPIPIKGTDIKIIANNQKGFNDLYYLGIKGQADSYTLDLVMKLSKRVNTLWDVGAYIGLDALVSLHFNKNLNVVAFEPSPQNFKTLKKNIELNESIASGIRPMQVGLSKQNSEQTFYFSASNPLMGSLKPVDGFVEEKVKVYTGDALVSEENIPIPELIKLDVEGYESEVLSGCTSLLGTMPLILIEVLTEKSGQMVEEVLPKGYEFYGIMEETGTLVKKNALTRLSKRSKNYLLVDTKKSSEILSYLEQ